MLTGLIFGMVFAAAQTPAAPAPERKSAFWATSPDPALCVVIMDDMGDVGFRIAESQMLAESAAATMLKRVGYGGMVYEGMKTQAAKLKRMMGSQIGTGLQEDQLEYYRLAEKSAKYRIRIRFKRVGKGKRRKETVTLTCREQGKSPKHVLEKKVFKAKSFKTVRAELEEEMKTFCAKIPTAPAAAGTTKPKQDGPTGLSGSEKRRQKKLKGWTPPPPRN